MLMAAFFLFLGLVLIAFRAEYGRNVSDFQGRWFGLEFDEIQLQYVALFGGIGLIGLAILMAFFDALK